LCWLLSASASLQSSHTASSMCAIPTQLPPRACQQTTAHCFRTRREYSSMYPCIHPSVMVSLTGALF
jgi:hypothetical protein